MAFRVKRKLLVAVFPFCRGSGGGRGGGGSPIKPLLAPIWGLLGSLPPPPSPAAPKFFSYMQHPKLWHFEFRWPRPQRQHAAGGRRASGVSEMGRWANRRVGLWKVLSHVGFGLPPCFCFNCWKFSTGVHWSCDLVAAHGPPEMEKTFPLSPDITSLPVESVQR